MKLALLSEHGIEPIFKIAGASPAKGAGGFRSPPIKFFRPASHSPGYLVHATGGASIRKEQSKRSTKRRDEVRARQASRPIIHGNSVARRGVILDDLADALSAQDPRSRQFIGPFELRAA